MTKDRKTEDVSALEAQIAAMHSRREALIGQRAAAETKRAAAKAGRVEMLKAGGALEQHNTALRQAADEVAGINELVGEIDIQLAETERRFEIARKQEDCEIAAEALEAMGPRAVAAAADLDTAMIAVGAAFAKVVQALPALDDLAKRDADRIGRQEIAAALMFEALLAHCPDLAVSEYRDGGYRVEIARMFTKDPRGFFLAGTRNPLDAMADRNGAAAFAREAVVGALSYRASQIRSGVAPAVIGARVAANAMRAQPPKRSPPAPIEIVARENFQLRNLKLDGQVEELAFASVLVLPADVATHAIVSGLAYRTGTDEAVTLVKRAAAGARPAYNAVGKLAVVRTAGGGVVSEIVNSSGSHGATVKTVGQAA